LESIEWYWIWIGGVAAFAVAWINGANNAANAIGSAVGAKALSVKKALWFASIFDFLGAIIFGNFVSLTLLRGVVDTTELPARTVVVGMVSALFATALWVILSTLMKVPMSISQAIVGGVLGFGLVAAGVDKVNWSKMGEIIASWIYLPFMSIIISIILYKVFVRIMNRIDKRRLILLTTIFFYIIIFTTVFLLNVKTLRVSDLAYAMINSLAISFLFTAIFIAYIYKTTPEDIDVAKEHVFKILLLSSCAAMSFSHGANDVANSAGPFAGIIYVVNEGSVPKTEVSIPFPALTLSAAGIALGILMWGYSVVETIGEKITVLSIETAFIAQFSASITTLIVTRMGLPVSTTVAVVGAITGVGLAKGVSSINFKTLFRIITMWFIGFPVVAGLTAFFMTLI